MELLCTKGPGGALLPLDDEQAEAAKALRSGEILRVDVKHMRNGPYFRRWWALAKVAFDIWAETRPRLKHRGVEVQPNFDRFRKDLTIMAGFYEPVFAATGELRLQAKSLSFSSMGEDEFVKLYSATIDAVLAKILGDTGMTREKLDAAVDRVLRFS